MILLFVSSLQTVSAQSSGNIQGVVLNELGTPLAKVTVIVKETNKGTSTDTLGRFTIAAQKGQTLAVLHGGYTSQEWLIRTEESVNLTLSPSISSLDDVVVIGYGARKKATLTGAVAAVTGKEVVTTKE